MGARGLWGPVDGLGCLLVARWSRDINSDLTVGLLAAGAVGGFGCRPLEAFRGRFDLTLIFLELQMQPNMTRIRGEEHELPPPPSQASWSATPSRAPRSPQRPRQRWRRQGHRWRKQPRSTVPVGGVQLEMHEQAVCINMHLSKMALN